MTDSFSEKLNQFQGFHDSKVKHIYIETNRRILVMEIDHAYTAIPSSGGEVVCPTESGDSVERYQLLYRPLTVFFKDVVKMEITSEFDPINEEIILSCEVVKGRKNSSADLFHVTILLTSMSRISLVCKDFECKQQ